MLTALGPVGQASPCAFASHTQSCAPCLRPRPVHKCGSVFQQHQGHRQQHSQPHVCRAVPLLQLADLEILSGLSAATLPLSGLVGFLIWKFVTYSRLEYITAAMLARYVTREPPGPKVIQVLGGTREMYYYPKNLQQVTVVGANLNKSMLEQAGIQAGIPAVAKVQPHESLSFQGGSSVDALVSLGGLAELDTAKRAAFIDECLRVLKPGRPMIFIEKLPGGIFLRGLGASNSKLEESALQGLKQNPAFEVVEWDVVLGGQDPHAVGVAVKSANYTAPPLRTQKEAVKEVAKEAVKKEPVVKKGFK